MGGCRAAELMVVKSVGMAKISESQRPDSRLAPDGRDSAEAYEERARTRRQDRH
jgi:hypothetical protein